MINWTERYNCHRGHIGRFEINVDWTSNGFRVGFMGTILVKRFESLDQAKRAGIELARVYLTDALKQLPEVLSNSGTNIPLT